MRSFTQDCWLWVWFVAAYRFPVASAQCYYPGGAWADDQFPCDKFGSTSLCCPTGWTCFSNQLCVATDPSVVSTDIPLGTALRGTCTNPLWNDTVCGDFCLNDPVSANNGSLVTCGENKWCCAPDSADGICNCNTGKGTFQVSDGTAQTIIGIVGLQHTSTAPVSPSTLSSSASTSVSKPSSFSTVTISSSASSSVSSRTSSRKSTSHTSSVSSSTSSSKSISHTSPVPISTSLLKSTSRTSSPKTKSSNSVTPASKTSSAAGSANTTTTSIADTSTPVTHTTAFKAGIGTTAAVLGAIAIGLLIWALIRLLSKRNNRNGSQLGSSFNQDAFAQQHPEVTDAPFEPVPSPHPYEPASMVGMGRPDYWNGMSSPGRNGADNPYADEYSGGLA